METESVILDTPRLRLRPLRRTDAARIQQIFAEWELVKFLATAIPWPYPADGAQAFLEVTLPKNEDGRQFDWAITLRAAGDDLLIGIISLYPGSDEDSRGFWLGRDFQNQGLMKEAVFAVNEFAFNELGMTRLLLNNAEPNRASHRLKEISGATVIGIEGEAAFIGGRFRRVRWLLTREDWQRHRRRFQTSENSSLAASVPEDKGDG